MAYSRLAAAARHTRPIRAVSGCTINGTRGRATGKGVVIILIRCVARLKCIMVGNAIFVWKIIGDRGSRIRARGTNRGSASTEEAP